MVGINGYNKCVICTVPMQYFTNEISVKVLIEGELMPQTSNGTLLTDNLELLKENEIFIDSETGKKYRVRKTILPQYSASGPHGLDSF
ncbi:hypothetical protein DICVIV_04932 [Dictyocaulus viviparus]|uniref:Uncharacterized protein n=1 Tax=Dictyocaulus viviparus TaxID=29172 RepID=A0A0D8XYN8_DICVI|nr:hypothetical protein DICVIV_04932 [Dictyocaulus viviparus]